jgi:hypothetical protein
VWSLTSTGTSAEVGSGDGANADAEADLGGSEPPHEPPQDRSAPGDTRPDPTLPNQDQDQAGEGEKREEVLCGGEGDRFLAAYESLEGEKTPEPSALNDVLARLGATIAEAEHRRATRLAELREIGSGPPAGEEEVLRESGGLIMGGVLVELPAEREPEREPEPKPHRPLCQYPSHRASDWCGQDGQLVCGVCHPRVTPRDLVEVSP